jgi:hypothetical protein
LTFKNLSRLHLELPPHQLGHLNAVSLLQYRSELNRLRQWHPKHSNSKLTNHTLKSLATPQQDDSSRNLNKTPSSKTQNQTETSPTKK